MENERHTKRMNKSTSLPINVDMAPGQNLNDSAHISIRSYNVFPRRKMSYEKVQPKGFGTLPIKVLIQVFQYIDQHEVLNNLTLVNKHWRQAVKQPEFMKVLCVKGQSIPLPRIYDHLRCYTLLHTLRLNNVENPKVILMQASKFCKGIKCIGLTNYDWIDASLLRYLIRTFPELEGLDLERSSFKGEVVNYGIINAFMNLKSLNLSKLKNITMKNILEIVLNCRNLVELNVSLLPPMVDLSDDDARLMITNMTPNLLSLCVDARSLTNRTFEKLFEVDGLTKLRLNYCGNMTNEILREIPIHLPNLTEFGITHNFNITGEDVRDVFLASGDILSKLTRVDFTYCVLITDVGVSAMAKCCKKLQRVQLKCCRLLTNIDELCKYCKYLYVLDISFCTSIKPTFRLRRRLERLVLNECDDFAPLIEKAKARQGLQVYAAQSEYTDELERL